MTVKNSALRRKETLTGLGFALPSLLGFLSFFVIPFGIVIWYTFTQGIGGAKYAGLANYADILVNPAFLLAAQNTGRFFAVSVPLICVLSFLLALCLQKVGRRWLRTSFIIPLIIPVATVTMFFQIAFADQGPIIRFLEGMNISPQSFLHSSNAFWTLVILYLWKNIGYTVILFLAGLATIPREYYHMASLDGAGEWQQTVHITLPHIVPTAFFVIIIAIIRSFSAFREAYLLAGEYPHRSIYMLQHFMNNNYRNLNYQRLSVAALLVFFVIFAFVLLMYFVKNKTEEHQA